MDIMGPLKSSSLHLHICYKHNPKPLVIIKLARALHWGNSPSNLSLFLAASIKPELPVPRLFISQHKPTNPPTSAQIINRGRNSVYSCVSWSLKHVVRLPLSCCSLFVTNKHIDPRTNSAVCRSVSGECVTVVCRPQREHMIDTFASCFTLCKPHTVALSFPSTHTHSVEQPLFQGRKTIWFDAVWDNENILCKCRLDTSVICLVEWQDFKILWMGTLCFA